jgi:tetratricopeptide (TPR) repeat protein
MEPNWKFRYSLPPPKQDGVVEITAKEAENILLENLNRERDNPDDALWQLAKFYSESQQSEKGLEYFHKAMDRLPDAERKASCLLAMGQAMERADDYHAALRYYKEAMALEPTDPRTWYLVHNNIGFCLNTLGNFQEGKTYCQRAIAINPDRHNAYKNLGIAQQGLGRFCEAAKCFIVATQANASDPRSAKLLTELLREHPELQPEFGADAECCTQAVKSAEDEIAKMQPVVHQGWKEQMFLLRIKLRGLSRRFNKFIERVKLKRICKPG